MQGTVIRAATTSLLSNVLLSGAAMVSLAVVCGELLGFGAGFVLAAATAFVLAALVFAALAWRHLDGPRLGAANSVTLLRLAMTALLSALLLTPVSAAALWFCIGVATCTLVLDGVDGLIARRCGTSSRFGARFDMEVDALLICVLALLAWHFERAGIWVLAAGLLRYAFVGAAYAAPWLRAGLPPSFRRKAVCIVQSTTLLICMGPIVPAQLAPWVAAAGVALLVWSFGADVVWLHANRSVALRA